MVERALWARAVPSSASASWTSALSLLDLFSEILSELDLRDLDDLRDSTTGIRSAIALV